MPARSPRDLLRQLPLSVLGNRMSSASIQALEHHRHRVPEGAEIVVPKLCGLCAHQLYKTVAETPVCRRCLELYTFANQLWSCADCGAVRKWGENTPEDKAPKRLNCASCCDVTEHRYVEVARGFRNHT